ncbi:MAG: hypothetical protein JSV11_03760 [Nitrospiraceae bacterium]|nr:MAG: hypothetical protein JSV11_03760 [Nitrospiraceae bacterium]
MNKECCNIRVSETEKGLSIEVEGDTVKERCREMMENCCSGDSMKNFFQSCCTPEK